MGVPLADDAEVGHGRRFQCIGLQTYDMLALFFIHHLRWISAHIDCDGVGANSLTILTVGMLIFGAAIEDVWRLGNPKYSQIPCLILNS